MLDQFDTVEKTNILLENEHYIIKRLDGKRFDKDQVIIQASLKDKPCSYHLSALFYDIKKLSSKILPFYPPSETFQHIKVFYEEEYLFDLDLSFELYLQGDGESLKKYGVYLENKVAPHNTDFCRHLFDNEKNDRGVHVDFCKFIYNRKALDKIV